PALPSFVSLAHSPAPHTRAEPHQDSDASKVPNSLPATLPAVSPQTPHPRANPPVTQTPNPYAESLPPRISSLLFPLTFERFSSGCFGITTAHSPISTPVLPGALIASPALHAALPPPSPAAIPSDAYANAN